MGGMYALIAIGYTMVYGIIELINFAHGEIFMVGAFIALGIYLLLVPFFPPLAALLIATILSMILTGLVGVVIEKLAYRPLRNSSRIAALLSALGVSIFLNNFVRVFFPDPQPFPKVIDGSWQIGGVIIQRIDLWIVIVALFLMVGLHYLVTRTQLGRAMRAVAQDRDAARLMGIDPDRIISLTFIIGSALAAVGGIMNGLKYNSIEYDMGFIVGIKAFTAAVLGGIGDIRGAMLGGFLLGICETVVVAVLYNLNFEEAFDYKDVIAFSILIVILYFRPTGILGGQREEKV